MDSGALKIILELKEENIVFYKGILQLIDSIQKRDMSQEPVFENSHLFYLREHILDFIKSKDEMKY